MLETISSLIPVLPATHPFVGMNVPLVFRRIAETHSDSIFLVWEPFSGKRASWTYEEARADVLRLAAGLIAKGVRAGDTVAIHLENSPESILIWLACSEVGAIAVTINVRCSGSELAYFVGYIDAVGIVTQPQFEDMVREHLPSIGWCVIVPPGGGVAALGAGDSIPPRPYDPAAPFSVQFTSGTTSRPKAVLWTHGNALWGAMVNARHFGLTKEDVVLIHNPMFHTTGQAWQTLAAMWVGGTVVMQPKFSASRFWEVALRNKCTYAMGGIFVEQALSSFATPSNHSMQFVLGEANRSPANSKLGIRVLGSHGMTELITQSIFCDRHGPFDEGALGRPAPEYQVALLDPEGQPVEAGQPGEICVKGVRGLTIFTGYIEEANVTASSFTADGYFRTGDIARQREDGALTFVDRVKDMLKVGGENVAASEVETVIREIEGVSEVAVVGQEHPLLIEVPFAFVIAKKGASNDLAARIVAVCATALADFKVPRGVEIVDDFPRSTGGAKVVKAALRERLNRPSDT